MPGFYPSAQLIYPAAKHNYPRAKLLSEPACIDGYPNLYEYDNASRTK